MPLFPGKRLPPPTLKSVELPAPVGGLNSLDAATALPPTDCLVLYNMTAAELGLRVRQGWQEWAAGLSGAADTIVRTIIPFSGSHKDGTKDRLFATTSKGIFDVTSAGAVPLNWAGVTSYQAGSISQPASFVSNAPAWVTLTAYVVAQQVTKSGQVYTCTTAGTSNAGPSGTGTGITDGTCVWSSDTLRVYTCVTTGTSAASGGPTGTTAGIADGTCVWNYLANNVDPPLLVTFGTQSDDAGYGTFITMINGVAGDHTLLYCDEENGYHVWSETSGTWSKVTQGSGGDQINNVDPATFVGVTVWKNRVWFVQKDTTVAWYLGVNAMFGSATAFDFGPRMRSGGPLTNLFNWSYDAGGGMDTLLVGVSTGGDVVIYQGTDPSSASTFAIKGSWSVGGVPFGRRIATEFGGELLIMSMRGVVQMSKLVVGAPAAVGKGVLYDSDKIAPLFNVDVQTFYSNRGWEIGDNPGDNALMCLVPANGSGAAAKPYVMAMSNQGWSVYRDLPMVSRGTWNGVMYFGTPDGRVAKVGGYVDGVLLGNSTGFSLIDWSMLTGFSSGGSLSKKQVQSIIPMLEAQEPNPTVNAEARYDLDISEATAPSAMGTTGTGSTWNSAVWDSSIWGGSYTQATPVIGAVGMGRTVAIAVRGKAASRTSLVGIGVMFTEGGVL